VRTDNINEVPHARSDHTAHLMELFRAPQGAKWGWNDLTQFHAAATVASKLTSYIRFNGGNATVYGSHDDHIHEQVLLDGQWLSGDLTLNSGAPAENPGNLSAYVRSDNADAVVYCSTLDSHIHELFLMPGLGVEWQWDDLTQRSGAPNCDPGGVAAYQRTDGIDSVVFVATLPLGSTPRRPLIELYSDSPTVSWHWANLSVDSGTTVDADPSSLTARIRPTNVNSVLFLDLDRHIHECSFVIGYGWSTSDLTQETSAPPGDAVRPKSYTRADGKHAVVFSDSLGGLHEIVDDQGWSLNTLMSPAEPHIDFYPYLRSDGVNAIVCFGTDEHVWELSQSDAGSPWVNGDVTDNAGEPVR
jgi:hypothetical protein